MKCPVCSGQLELVLFGGHPRGLLSEYDCPRCKKRNLSVRLSIIRLVNTNKTGEQSTKKLEEGEGKVPESAWRKQRREKQPHRTKPEIDPKEPYFWPP